MNAGQSSIDVANYFIKKNKSEFIGIRSNRDPRKPKVNWLTVDDVIKIHENIIYEIGGKSGIHNKQDLKYALERPLIQISGTTEKGTFEQICECAYDIGNCFIDARAQIAATVFLTLCNLNEYNVAFKVGDIFDIFPKVLNDANERLELKEFKKIMMDHLVFAVPKNDIKLLYGANQR